MNRGSTIVRMDLSVPRNCFNEAPIHESGKSRSWDGKDGEKRYGFNEAPIHESGKSDLRARRSLSADRFNEAPIHESGKYRRPHIEAEKIVRLQ